MKKINKIMNKKIIFLLFGIMFIGLTFSLPNDMETRIDFNYPETTNYSLVNTNASEYWITNDGNLDNINTTQLNNNNGYLEIVKSWFDDLYLLLDGSNANQNIDVSPYNITADYFKGDGSQLTGIVSDIPDENVVRVNQNLTDDEEVTGEVYNNIADALAYIDTQNPNANDWWCLKLGSGQYSENVTIPEYVLILGQGRWATEITGEFKGETGATMLSLAVDSVKISDLRADNDALILFFNCVIGGGSDTAGTTANYIFFDSLIQGGTFDDIAQFHTYNSIIHGGTFSATSYNQFVNTFITPLMGNVVFGDDVYLDGCRITYSGSGGTTSFTDEAKTTRMSGCSYVIAPNIGATVPTFNTPSRTYNFYNTFLGDATYTAGTFNHYGTAEADENRFEKLRIQDINFEYNKILGVYDAMFFESNNDNSQTYQGVAPTGTQDEAGFFISNTNDKDNFGALVINVNSGRAEIHPVEAGTGTAPTDLLLGINSAGIDRNWNSVKTGTDNVTDLGASDKRWQNGYFNGVDTNYLQINNPATSCSSIGSNCFTVQVNGSTQTCVCFNMSEYSIFNLSDVLDTANDLEFLQYNSTSGNWQPKSIETTYYNATTSDLVAGALDGGSLNDTKHSDGNYDGVTMNISEDNTAPGLDIRINFTNVNRFDRGIVRYKTSELVKPFPVFQIYDYGDGEWEDYAQAVESSNFRIAEVPVFDDDGHIQNGVVQVRLFKQETGKTNNEYFFDWLSISKGFGTPAGQEVDPIWSKAKSDYWNTSENVNANQNNITNVSYGLFDNVGIGTDSPSEELDVQGNLKLTNHTLSPDSITFDSETSTGLRVQNENGYLSLTPLNLGWLHLYTDRSKFILKPSSSTLGGVYSYYGQFSSYSTNPLTLSAGGSRDDLYIKNDNGYIGIGTDSPQNELNVIGDGNFTGNLTIGDKITFGFGEMIDNLVDGWLRITGNLNVTGNITADYFKGDGSQLTGISGFNDSKFTEGSVLFSNGSSITENNSNLFWNNTNSRLGIGTDNPISLLSVGNEAGFTGSPVADASPEPRLTMDNIFDNSGDPSVNKWVFYNYVGGWVGGIGMSGNDMDMFVGQGGNFRFHTGTTNIDGSRASEIMVIENTGNVGIGTDTPSEKLDVVGNATISGSLSVGSNLQGGLSEGDINASTIYYDTLTAKSPIILCSDDWCSVMLPKNKKTYYIEKDDNWNLLNMTDEKGDDMEIKGKVTTDENGYIIDSSETEIKEIINKTFRLRDKKECELSGYNWDGECFENYKKKVTYEEAINKTESYEIKTIEEEYSCTKLNETTLEEYQTTCINLTEEKTNNFKGYSYSFYNNCGWDENVGYYCNERRII